MRSSIIRLIWFRELRDQLRDRRTVFMMAVVPLLLYPLVGVGMIQVAAGFTKRSGGVGVVGAENLPPATAASQGLSPLPATSWFTLTPGAGLDRALGAAALAHAAQQGLGQDYPPLLFTGEGRARFPTWCFEHAQDADSLKVVLLPSPDQAGGPDDADAFLARVDRDKLDRKEVDLLVVIPPDFQARLARGERPTVFLLGRESDDRSRLLASQVRGVLTRWKKRVKEIKLLRQGLPTDFDDPVEVRDPEAAKPPDRVAAERLFDSLVRIFPFMLVMWSLAGALYPAVDLCAGEKERGTMETLLISPVARAEIVWGKFLAIWTFSAATAFLNLLSMTVTAWNFRGLLPSEALRPTGLMWCVVLVLPLAAFFSALCLAVGVYARSSKEGQYYLMPLFLVTMPLIFLTLAPGVQLNAFCSMIPVTGVALLMQRLILVGSWEQIPWFYFLPVLGPMALYGWFALRWAIEQFNREEVLFREAERLDIGLWLQRLFREKETLPSAGQALFVFGLIVVLRWLAFSLGANLAPLARTAIELVAFVAAPTIFMAVLLTTRPAAGLALRLPTWRQAGLGAVLVVLLAPPLAETVVFVLHQFPALMQLMTEHDGAGDVVRFFGESRIDLKTAGPIFAVYVILLPLCEELAFRGFLLGGLQRRFGPWRAILLTSFAFAVYHMNVFHFIPVFLIGLVLGILAVRTRSIWPGVLLHAGFNGFILGLGLLLTYDADALRALRWIRWIYSSLAIVPAILVLWRLSRGLTTTCPPADHAGLSRPVSVNGVAADVREKTLQLPV